MTNRQLLRPDDELRLVELVNRVLDRGVVLSGDVMISVAGIDLVYLELRLMLAAVDTARKAGANLPPRRPG
jgi:gas vesicle structural protein